MDTGKTIKRTDLHDADVLLFPPNKNSIISQLISIITNSPVSHATMYNGQNQLIQETLPCAGVDGLTDELINKYGISVMRFNSKVDSMDKVLARARYYVAQKAPFAKLDLLPVGVFILLKQQIISSALRPLLILLMQKVIAEIIYFINSKAYPDSTPMTCSQFVYNCYREAGEEYVLKINNAYSSQNILRAVQEYIEQKISSLEPILADNLNHLSVNSRDLHRMDNDKLLHKIYNELTLNQMKDTTGCKIDDEFAIVTHKFCSLIRHFFYNTENSPVPEPMNRLEDLESLFVTPGDLLSNCDNLTYYGVLTVD